jgi:hypothetical protein
MRDKFNQLLIQLGIDLNLVLIPDHENSCTFKIDNKLTMQIKVDKTQNDLLIGSFLCELPPGKFRENVFINTLKSNGQIPLNSVFSFNDPSSELVLFKYLSLEKIDLKSLKYHLEEFIEKAVSWKEAIESGQTAPLEFLRRIEHSKSSIFDLKL